MPPVGPWQVDGVLRYQLEIPVETPSNNVIKGMHFHAYKNLRRQWRLLMSKALAGVEARAPLERAFLVVRRECAGGGLDWDNAYGGLKPMLDCLVAPSARNPDGMGLIQDDNPKNMPHPPYVQQCSAKPGHGRTTVFIYELNAEADTQPATAPLTPLKPLE